MILHVDMNAYFATLEQQWNPELRGKPIIVCGKGSGERTVVATASYEAKRLGVKTAMAVWQAKKICPQAILVPAHYQKYVATTKKIIAILESFTPDVEVFSIDEAFLKIDRNQLKEIGRQYRSQKTENRSPLTDFDYPDLANQIKKQIRAKIGDLCTCSIGIAPNKLLAKIASEFRKPDGLTIVTPVSRLSHSRGGYLLTPKELLESIGLEAVPGIGPRVLERLNYLGITTVKALQNAKFSILSSEFGPAYAEFLYNACHGIDNSPLVRFRQAPEEKSFGHSYTLPKEIYTLKDAKAVLLHLAEKVGVRMRAKGFLGRTVHIWLRFTDMTSWGQQTTIYHPTDDGYKIYKIGERMIDNAKFKNQNAKSIRAVGISCTNLTKSQQLSLFLSDRRKNRISNLLDKVNHKHGESTLLRAEILPTLSVVEDIPDGRNNRQFIVY